MNDTIKNRITVILLAGLLFGFALWSWIKPADAITASERRDLAQFPTLSMQTVTSGAFMKGFESYSTDQFPLRDAWRTLRAYTVKLLGQQDNHNVYLHEGYAAQMEYPMDAAAVEYAAGRFRYIRENFLAQGDHKLYFALVPDKGEFLAEASGHPGYAYQDMEEAILPLLPGDMEYVPIRDLLELSDYYRTDTHWRQEAIADVAERLAQAMGAELHWDYETQPVLEDFSGVYTGQSALPLSPDVLSLQQHPGFADVTVTNHETGENPEVYDLPRLTGLDPYEVFLSGPQSMITIENPHASSDRELILFRDSYGSSIAPYFVEAYARITLIDIRTLPPQNLPYVVELRGDEDVLFLYSTLVLNNSETLK